MNAKIAIPVFFAAGLVVGAGGAAWFGRAPAAPKLAPSATAPSAPSEGDDEESLLTANANLVSSLQECNRRLADLGQKRVASPALEPAPSPSPATSRPSRTEGRGERTAA